jgi:hypothetical protein
VPLRETAVTSGCGGGGKEGGGGWRRAFSPASEVACAGLIRAEGQRGDGDGGGAIPTSLGRVFFAREEG